MCALWCEKLCNNAINQSEQLQKSGVEKKTHLFVGCVLCVLCLLAELFMKKYEAETILIQYGKILNWRKLCSGKELWGLTGLELENKGQECWQEARDSVCCPKSSTSILLYSICFHCIIKKQHVPMINICGCAILTPYLPHKPSPFCL